METALNYGFSAIGYDEINLRDSQGTASVISDLDIKLLKQEMNAIDCRIRDEVIGQILELTGLKNDWDSYGAVPISEKAIVNAYHFVSRMVGEGAFIIKRPFISPEPNGGILLKWKWVGRDLLVWFPPDNADFVYLENFSGERTGGQVASLDDLLALYRKWQRG